jgi:uncharacterized phage protein (TIGR02220 family)|nr:MAG TPA: hypothetical protein [Caudoviricetes sp.]
MSKQLKKTTPGAHAGTARIHAYNVGLAIDLNDTIAAIIFHHIHMNIIRLVENKYVDDDGIAWLTVSKSGIMRFLPEFTESQIKTAINKLTDNWLLVKKVSNRKNSYTLSELGWSYYPLLEEEGPVKAPKAEVKTDAAEAKVAVKTRSDNVINVNDNIKEIIDYVNEKTGKCFNYAASYIKNINELFAAGYTKEDMIAVVDQRFEELSGTKEFNAGMNPSKLLFIKTFPNYLKDAKCNNISMTPEQLIKDAEMKEEYHLKEMERCKCERLILESDPDNLPFLTMQTSPEVMIKDRVRKERYHRNEAKKFANMQKLIKSVK